MTLENAGTRAHNDQLIARAMEDLDLLVAGAKRTLSQGDRTDATAVIAITLEEEGDVMDRNRLATMLAMALVRLADHAG